jgi:hypothetical protein
MRRNEKSEHVTQKEKMKRDRKQLLIMQRKKLRRKNPAKNFKAGC